MRLAATRSESINRESARLRLAAENRVLHPGCRADFPQWRIRRMEAHAI
jgi:hypothetical protein